MRGSFLAASLALYFDASLALRGERRQSTNSTWSGPLADGGNAWGNAFTKAKQVVAQMTLEEKVNVTTGVGGSSLCAGNTGAVPRLDIPSFCLQDGPAGVRPADFASQFPAQVTVAATWDRDLIYSRAAAIAAEFRGKGVHVALAPVTGGPLGRSPLGGRNWEGFSADPYYSSIGSYLSVKGFQDKGVVATSKHYALYEQETNRNPKRMPPSYNGTYHPLPISSDVDDATFHETYLLSFAEAVRAGTGSIMCCYNRINGSHGCEDDVTLNQVLKGELDYQGYVMSDWFAHWTDDGGALGGLDMSMPGTGFWGPALVELVNNGTVPIARIDDMVHRILMPYYALGQDKGFPVVQYNTSGIGSQTYLALNPGNTNVDVQEDHYKIIRKIGEESATLLKNVRSNGGGLPLGKSKFLAVFGQDAGANPDGLLYCGSLNRCGADHPNNGTNTVGGGSGAAYAPYLVTPLEAIQAKVPSSTQVNWLLNDLDLETAKTNALIADTSIVFTYAYQDEGQDRDNLTLWSNGDDLINTVAAQCNNTIVIVHSGQQVLMESWVDNPNITAVVFAYFPGQETGNAIASVLYGDVNPSGKLPFTLAKSAADYPPNGIYADNVTDPHVVFEEGNLIDYRWQNVTPRFEFGFGLSYTTFSYSNIKLQRTPGKPTDGVHLTKEPFDGNGTLYDVAYTITASVKNTGSVAGCEVAQLYLSYPASQTNQPLRSLRGFDKLCLNKGQSKTTTFKIRQKDHAVWDVVRQTWTIPKGEFGSPIVIETTSLPAAISDQGLDLVPSSNHGQDDHTLVWTSTTSLFDISLTSLFLTSSAYLYLLHHRRAKPPATSASQAYILTNQVTHARLLPAESKHAFSYHTLSLLLSLSALETGSLNIGWGGVVFGYPGTRGRICGLRPQTYGTPGTTIREKLVELLRPSGINLGEVWMMMMPSLLGFEGINPLTVYFCYEKGKRNVWGLVHNTFGERHAYILQVGKGEDPEDKKNKEYSHQWTFPRQFHVSPFNDRSGHYVCSVVLPSHPPTSTPIPLSEPPRPIIRLHLLTAPPAPQLKLVALLRPVLSEPLSARTLLAALALPPFTSKSKPPSSQGYLDSDVPKPSLTSWPSLPLGAALLLTSLRIVYQAAHLHYRRGLAVFARPEPVAGTGREWVEKALGGVWNDIQPADDVTIGGSIGWQSESATERWARKRFESWVAERDVIVRIASTDPAIPITELGTGNRELTVCYRSPRTWTCILLAPTAEYALAIGSKTERWFSVSDEDLFCELWKQSTAEEGWMIGMVHRIRVRLASATSLPFPLHPCSAHPLDGPASPALLWHTGLLYVVFHIERLVFGATGARFVKGDTPWRAQERVGRRARIGAGGVGSVIQ